MFKEIVEVESIHGSRVTVVFKRKSMCSCCSMRFLCASDKDTGIVSNPLGLDLKPGDKAEISLSEGSNILSSVLAFALPAVLFVCSLFLLRNKGEVFSFSISLLVTVFYFFIMNKIMKKTGKELCYRITAKL